MQAFIDFLVNNYTWFLTISLVLIFALIGYLVDTNERKDFKNESAHLDALNTDSLLNQTSEPRLEVIKENEQK